MHSPLLTEFLAHLCQPEIWHPIWHWALFLSVCAFNMVITLQLSHHNSCNSPNYISLLSSLLGSWISLLYDGCKARFPDLCHVFQMLLPTFFHLKTNTDTTPSSIAILDSKCWSDQKKKKSFFFYKIICGLCPSHLITWSLCSSRVAEMNNSINNVY